MQRVCTLLSCFIGRETEAVTRGRSSVCIELPRMLLFTIRSPGVLQKGEQVLSVVYSYKNQVMLMGTSYWGSTVCPAELP